MWILWNFFKNTFFTEHFRWLPLYIQKRIWLAKFPRWPRVQEKWQIHEQQSYISVSVHYLNFQVVIRDTSPDMTTVFQARLFGRFIEIKNKLKRGKLDRTNQGSNFLGRVIDNVRVTMQIREERQYHRIILLSANPTKWSNTVKQFVGNLTVLWDWRLKG